MTVSVIGAATQGVAVVNERLHFSDPSIGGVYNNPALDQGALVQLWLDALGTAIGGRGTGFFSGDVYMAGRELSLPAQRYIGIDGAGAGNYATNGSAALIFTSDPGAGKVALKLNPNAPPPYLRDFALIGFSDTAPVGSFNWAGEGLGVNNRCIIDNVPVRGFYSAARLVNDHFDIRRCDWSGNGNGVHFADNPLGGLGDITMDRIFTINQNMANYLIASTACAANAWMPQGHAGAAPYGFLRYQALNAANGTTGQTQITGVNVPYTPVHGMTIHGPQSSPRVDSTTPIPAGTYVGAVSGSAGNWTLTLVNGSNAPVALTGTVTQVELGRRAQAVQGLTLARHSFEYNGNQLIRDEVGGATWAFRIEGNAEFGTGGSAKWPGKPWPAANIEVDILDVEWVGNGPGPQADNPDQPYFSVQDARIVVEQPLYFFDAANINAHPSFEHRSGGLGQGYFDCVLGRGVPGSGGSPTGSVRVTNGSGLRGYLLESVGDSGKVQTYTGAPQSRSVGFATRDFGAGEGLLYTTQALRFGTVVRNGGATTIPQNALLKPDPAHPGCVKAAADESDGPILGRVHDSAIPAASGGVPGIGPAEIAI